MTGKLQWVKTLVYNPQTLRGCVISRRCNFCHGLCCKLKAIFFGHGATLYWHWSKIQTWKRPILKSFFLFPWKLTKYSKALLYFLLVCEDHMFPKWLLCILSFQQEKYRLFFFLIFKGKHFFLYIPGGQWKFFASYQNSLVSDTLKKN